MTVNPLVSVLMTAYNREKFIGEAIEGVLSSTYKNFELIILDDHSTDNTVSIAKFYQNQDKRVRLFINKKNLGQFPNRNKAASYAGGEFLMNADSDDVMFADGIENCVKVMLDFPQSSFGMFYPHPENTPFVIDSKKAIMQHFFEKPFLSIGPGGTIIRRSFFNEINGYPVNYGIPGDMYFNLKATCFSPIVMLPFEFVFYRRHEGQEINNYYNYLIYNYVYLRDALRDLPLQLEPRQVEWLKNKNKRRLLVNITKYFLQNKSISKTRYLIKKTDFGIKDALQGVFHRSLG